MSAKCPACGTFKPPVPSIGNPNIKICPAPCYVIRVRVRKAVPA